VLSECLKHPFFIFYFSQAASSAFQSLYDNRNGILDAMGAFWKKVAENFHMESNVMGYEFINEPVRPIPVRLMLLAN